MARWRGQEPVPVVPGWIRDEDDDGFVLADWSEPDDFGLEPRAALYLAKQRWVKARVAWLNDHPDVAGILLEQLRDRVR